MNKQVELSPNEKKKLKLMKQVLRLNDLDNHFSDDQMFCISAGLAVAGLYGLSWTAKKLIAWKIDRNRKVISSLGD